MKIKESPNCNFCKDLEDSNEHMLLECENVKDLWLKVENWISDIGLVNYHLNNKNIILGELYKAHWINAIILITKKSSLTPEQVLLFQHLIVLKSR